jgi:Flp pilus assembly protein TadD
MMESPEIQALLQEAASAGASGNFARAERCCREVLESDHQNASALQLMGMVRWRSGDAREGERLLRESLAVAPGQPHVLVNLGDLLVSRYDHESAIECYTEAVRLAPRFSEAWLNLGIALGEKGNIEAAIDALQRSLELDPGNLRALYALGQAHIENADLENAIASYRHALSLNPEAVNVHEALNELLWEHGMRDDYLRSYPQAIEAAPHSLILRLKYAGALCHASRFNEAESVLKEASQKFGSEAGVHGGLGESLAGQGRVSEAIASFTKAVELAPDDVGYRQNLARILIVTGDFSTALRHMEAASEREPLHQRNIALRALCLRLLGDPRAARINDYERFVKTYKIPVPEGYRDIHEFNEALNRALKSLHYTQTHALNQTSRGGIRTYGNLFERKIKELQEVRKSIEQCIRRYIDELDDDPEHPFLSRKSERFDFSGSWSTRLEEQGFHINHIHYDGWISSAYYVSVPEVIGENESHAGWLKFGETNLELGELERIEKLVRPEEGLIALFPSYVFHGTVPFSSNEIRTTIAFDIVPV